jgi:hypothetical protein
MVLRQADSSTSWKILLYPPFFPQQDFTKPKPPWWNYCGSKYTLKIRNGWKYICLLPCIEKKSRSMVRFSTIKNCYLLLLHLALYEAILMQFEPNKVLINQLPKGYLLKQNVPNRKQLDLRKPRSNFNHAWGRSWVCTAMIDTI